MSRRRIAGFVTENPFGLLEWLSRWVLALVFLFAAVPKLLDVPTFAAIIGAYELLPQPLLLPVALLLPLAEVAAAAGLLQKRRWAPWLTALLMLVFMAVLSYGIFMGLDIDCGCFGENDPEYTAFHGLKTALVRDLLLLLPLLYLFFRSFYQPAKQGVTE